VDHQGLEKTGRGHLTSLVMDPDGIDILGPNAGVVSRGPTQLEVEVARTARSREQESSKRVRRSANERLRPLSGMRDPL